MASVIEAEPNSFRRRAENSNEEAKIRLNRYYNAKNLQKVLFHLTMGG